jgi:hypothetical protein
MMRCVGYVEEAVHGFCSRNPNGKTPFGRPGHSRVGNIKTYSRNMMDKNWTDLLPDRHVAGNSKYGELLGLIKCAEFVD